MKRLELLLTSCSIGAPSDEERVASWEGKSVDLGDDERLRDKRERFWTFVVARPRSSTTECERERERGFAF